MQDYSAMQLYKNKPKMGNQYNGILDNIMENSDIYRKTTRLLDSYNPYKAKGTYQALPIPVISSDPKHFFSKNYYTGETR